MRTFQREWKCSFWFICKNFFIFSLHSNSGIGTVSRNVFISIILRKNLIVWKIVSAQKEKYAGIFRGFFQEIKSLETLYPQAQKAYTDPLLAYSPLPDYKWENSCFSFSTEFPCSCPKSPVSTDIAWRITAHLPTCFMTVCLLLFLFQTLVRRIFLLQQFYQASTKNFDNTSAWFKKTLTNLKNIDNTARGLLIE